MKLHILGIGNATTKHRYHSNFFISYNDFGLLIDAGTTIRYSLPHHNISLKQITHIIITHFHHDHVGGLSELLNTMYWHFENNEHRPLVPTLILRKEQLSDIEKLLSPIFNNQGLTWQDYCKITFFENNLFYLNNLKLTCIVTDSLHCTELRSFGLNVISPEKNIIISGDIKALEKSTLNHYITSTTTHIFQDVSLTPNPVHATLQEVEQYYPSTIHHKVYAVHYDKQIAVNSTIQFAVQGQQF